VSFEAVSDRAVAEPYTTGLAFTALNSPDLVKTKAALLGRPPWVAPSQSRFPNRSFAEAFSEISQQGNRP
jgi:hypothetical protein